MFKRIFRILTLTLCIAVSSSLWSQSDRLTQYESDYLGVAASVYVDSLVITATKKGFDIEDFIEMVVKDSSFLHAFRNLKRHPYTIDYQQTFYNKKKDISAYYKGKREQTIEDDCRRMEKIEEDYSKKYYKRKKYRYYTASLFDKILLVDEDECSPISKGKSSANRSSKKSSAIDYHINLMKTVIFSPGTDVDMPLVGEKMAIFSDAMKDYYDYNITSGYYADSIDCYVFEVKVKDRYAQKKRTTIVRNLTTYFEKSSLDIVSRNYHMAFDQRLYDFDIHIQVDLSPIDDDYFPSYIKYDGYWDLLFKKPETCIFEANFYNFRS